MPSDSPDVSVTDSAASLNGAYQGIAEPPERLAQKRRHTLECVGQVHVNPLPLLEVMRAVPDDPDEVAAAISKCPTLAARLLSVTNSAAFPGRQVIENVNRAVIQLGASRARAIAMAFGLRLLNEPLNLGPQLTRSLWVASLRKAATAQLASELIDPGRVGEAYCRALIQDLGLPMLMAVDPDFYHNELIPGRSGEWSEQELARFGMDHGELGSRMLQSWNAAAGIIESTRNHHCPPAEFEGPDAMLTLPAFLASLLPHLDEEMTGTQREWLTTLHGQFLAHTYPSPDVFIGAACRHVETLTSGSAELDMSTLNQDLACAVAQDAVEMVGQLCRLESALGKQREGLDKLRYQAYTDSLTKLLNRRGFIQLAQRRAEEAGRRGIGACCLVLDLDDLKPVNDQFGHKAGDDMLRGMAKIMRRNIDRSDLVARTGGDEFAVFMLGVDRDRAQEIAQRLVKAQSTRLRVASVTEVPLRFSIGAVHVEKMNCSIQVEELLELADEAMYRRKHAGKGGLCFTSYNAAAVPES